MATELLAVGTTATQSTEQTLVAGATAKLLLKPGTGVALGYYSKVKVELKTAGGEWVPVGELSSQGLIAADIVGPASYRVRREATATGHACGVDLA